MSGGLLQIIAYGAQDVFLTGNPTITHFKSNFRRHTNFAGEAIEQNFTGVADFDKSPSVNISRTGDMLGQIYVQIDLPAVTIDSGCFRWINNIGHHIIDTVEFSVGGQIIDTHTGFWLDIWANLTQDGLRREGYYRMIGEYPTIYNNTDVDTSLQAWTGESKAQTQLYIPLMFWFCRHIGLSLPLVALQYHDVKLNIKFRRATECFIAGSDQNDYTPSLAGATVFADYYYLDTQERRRIAQTRHEYLIEQLQYRSQAFSATDNRIDLNFNHPVKELIWVLQNDLWTVSPSSTTAGQGNQWSNYTTVVADGEENCMKPADSANPVQTAKISLNGHARFSVRNGTYFNMVQPWQVKHTAVPFSPGINVYSFALEPEGHQPSGTCNFSRIDNAHLQYTCSFGDSATSHKAIIFAINYNVFRIMSGMGGIAYAN